MDKKIFVLILVGFSFLIINLFLFFKLNRFSKEKIVFVSDLVDFQIQPENKKLLENYLNQIGFFEKKGVSLRTDNNKQVSVKKLIIHLTDKKYHFNKFILKDKTYLRSNQEKYNQGVLDLYIGLNKDYYLKNDLKKASQSFSSQISLAVYQLTHPQGLNSKNLSFKNMPEILKDLYEKEAKQGEFIKIIKK